MTEAIILDYLSPGKAGKDLEGKDVKPKKNWVFPILHVINSHMYHFTNIPRIVFSDEADNDRKLQHSVRKLNTCQLKVDYLGKPTKAGIERCNNVLDELIEFIMLNKKSEKNGELLNLSREDVISLIPPVSCATTEDTTHSRKRKEQRRSFEQVGSDESDA